MRKEKQTTLEDIDFKSIAKDLNGINDVSDLMGDMMKKIINEMLQSELEDHLEKAILHQKTEAILKE